MGEECGNCLFVHYACADVLFQYDYELFLAGGGNGICAERNDYGEGEGNREYRSNGSL
ncbi:hypothetical protein IMSAGC002_03725 [Lachnospiraceae bacterium]|nr:hypothetical protein IMSAGC002_03725 [Lachnospiraceae bacterium]